KDVSTHYAYDGQGQLRFTIDPLGYVTEYIYYEGATTSNAIGLARKTVAYATALTTSDYSYAYIKGHLTTNAADRASYAIYNDRGEVSYAIDATGAVAAYVYDALGNVTKTTQFAALIDVSTRPSDAAGWKAWADAWAGSNGTNARIT